MADLDNVAHLPFAARVLTTDGTTPLGSATNPFNVVQTGAATAVTFDAVRTALGTASAAVDVNAQRLTGLADPSAAQDADTRAARDARVVSMRRYDVMFPIASGANYHTQFAAGAPINASSGFAQFVPPRTVQIARGGAGVATVYTVTGTRFGVTVTETLNSNGATTVQGARVYDTITSFTSDVNPTVTTDLQIGNGLGLSQPFTTLLGVGVDDVLEAPSSSHASTGTVVPASAPDNNRTYTVHYTPAVSP